MIKALNITNSLLPILDRQQLRWLEIYSQYVTADGNIIKFYCKQIQEFAEILLGKDPQAIDLVIYISYG